MKLLLTITSKGEGYTANVFDNQDGSYEFIGDMDNDVDGTPYWNQDDYGQPDTSLHYNGQPINGDKVPFIVLPPDIILAVPGIVLGCKAQATYRGITVPGVVADVGPHKKLGEGSPAMLRALGAPAYRNGNGGIDAPVVHYKFWPGVPAVVNGVTYKLQRYR